MDAEQSRCVKALLSASVTELFACYGVSCDLADSDIETPPEQMLELGSMVGFRGKTVRGGLAFVAPLDLMSEILPVPKDGVHPDLQLRDWSGEVANQLVGRLKNKLAASVEFHIGTPVCFTGRAIRLVFTPDANGVSLSFRADKGALRVHLDCSVETQLIVGDLDDIRITAEGEVLLF